MGHLSHDGSGEALFGGSAVDADAPPAPALSAEVLSSLLVFRLGAGWFAVDAHAVQEVVPTSRPVAVPGVPAFVHGVVSLSGRIVVQLDVHALLGVSGAQLGAAGSAEEQRPRCVVLQVEGMPFAFAADEVAGLMQVSRARMNAAQRPDGMMPESFALDEKVVSVVDVAALLAVAETAVGGKPQ